jgi:hypothetical protein
MEINSDNLLAVSLDHTIHQLVYEIMEEISKHAPNKTLREILHSDYYTLERNTISSSIVILLDYILVDIAKYSSHIPIELYEHIEWASDQRYWLEYDYYRLYVKCKEYCVAYENYLKSKKKGARSN